MNYFYRILHAITVAATLLAFGLNPDWPSPADVNRTSEDSMTSRLKAWTDENCVLHAVSIPGAQKTDLDTMVLDLEGRPDVVRVTWQLDLPPWNGDPGLLEKWNEIWGRNATAIIQIYPDFNHLERTTAALETWRQTILSHSLIADATQPLNPVPLFEMVSSASQEVHERYGRLRGFIWAIVFWAWLAAAVARHQTSWFTVPNNPLPWYVLWLGELIAACVLSGIGLFYYTRWDSATGLPISISLFGIAFFILTMGGAFAVDCASAWLNTTPKPVPAPVAVRKDSVPPSGAKSLQS